MKKLLFALTAMLCVAFPSARAQEAPALSNTQILNQTVQTCLTSMSAGLKDMDAGMRGMVMATMADTCRKTAVIAPEKQEGPSAWHYVWDGFKFVAQLHFAHKGQALVFNTLAGMAQGGLQTAENISLKSMDHLAEKPQVIIPAITPEGASILYPRSAGEF